MRYTIPLNTQFIGQKIIYEAVCASTNDWAIQCLKQKGVPAGTVVITDYQYQGRGQRGKVWHSEPNTNLTFSVILYPTFLAAQQSFALNIVATLAIQHVLALYIPHGLRIKWPNDIYYQGKKLSGVLIENVLEKRKLKTSIIGVGINVNQKSFTLPTPTSLSLICQRVFSLQQLLEQLLARLESNYLLLQKEGIAALQTDYLRNIYGMHEVHTFQDANQTFSGTIKGIDAAGRLIIEQTGGIEKHYSAQEVTFIA